MIPPYDEVFGHTEKTSTLLVDAKLRQEYENLHAGIGTARDALLSALKMQSGSKKDLDKELSSTFTSSDDQFYIALCRVMDEVSAQKDAPFASLEYDAVFDEKVVSLLGAADVKATIRDYITRLNELLDASTYFKKGTFNYKNGATIAQSLADNGFFAAKHTVRLNAAQALEITTQEQLVELIEKEKEGITNDVKLRKAYTALARKLDRNDSVRRFDAYLSEHEEILPHLANIDRFKEDVWKSYLKAQEALYKDVVTRYRAAEKRKAEIEDVASRQRTQWESVIDLFNSRFVVPFKLTAKNRVSVILGKEPLLTLGFTFEEGSESAVVEKTDLMRVLSQGEKKALYILNILFEVEARKGAQQNTVLVVDDIACVFRRRPDTHSDLSRTP
ncbi:MAG: phage infection protein, partial [bacterium]